jgi:TolA-binding protein
MIRSKPVRTFLKKWSMWLSSRRECTSKKESERSARVLVRLCKRELSLTSPFSFEIDRENVFTDLKNLETRKNEAKSLINQTKTQLKNYLTEINTMNSSDLSLIQIQKWYILKEKAIYKELNKLKNGDKILMGLFWCPKKFKLHLD